jgi:hypothetical protein
VSKNYIFTARLNLNQASIYNLYRVISAFQVKWSERVLLPSQIQWSAARNDFDICCHTSLNFRFAAGSPAIHRTIYNHGIARNSYICDAVKIGCSAKRSWIGIHEAGNMQLDTASIIRLLHNPTGMTLILLAALRLGAAGGFSCTPQITWRSCKAPRTRLSGRTRELIDLVIGYNVEPVPPSVVNRGIYGGSNFITDVRPAAVEL